MEKIAKLKWKLKIEKEKLNRKWNMYMEHWKYQFRLEVHRVKIEKCSHKGYWYNDYVGKEYDINKRIYNKHDSNSYILDFGPKDNWIGSGRILLKEDSKVIKADRPIFRRNKK